MTLDRNTYKKIKVMNREEMQAFLNNYYTDAFNEGVTKFGKQLADRVDKGIRNTSGIGEKRYNELIANINAELQKPAYDENN